MTTQQLIKDYARLLRVADQWKAHANLARDRIAERILKEGNFNNGSRATRYKVREAKVRSHVRRGYAALRITV